MIVQAEICYTSRVRLHRKHSISVVSIRETVPVEVRVCERDEAPLAARIVDRWSDEPTDYLRIGEDLFKDAAPNDEMWEGDLAGLLASKLRTEGEDSSFGTSELTAEAFGRVAEDMGDQGSRDLVLAKIRAKAASLVVVGDRVFATAVEPRIRLITFGFDDTKHAVLEDGSIDEGEYSSDWSIGKLDELESFVGRPFPDMRQAVIFADPTLLTYDQSTNHLGAGVQKLLGAVSEQDLREATIERLISFAHARDALNGSKGRFDAKTLEAFSSFAATASSWSRTSGTWKTVVQDWGDELLVTLARVEADIIEASDEHDATASFSL
jgi:hypothetical protein